MELRPGDRFGRYRVVRLLGRGGMGVVYEAADDAVGRGVALKVLNAELARDDPSALERFRREARAAGAISDPRVVTLLGVETAGPRVALVFELVPGGSLEELRVRSGGRLPWAEAARLAAELARGLAVIHQAGLVHRDVKPHNALLDAAGRLKVSDLGLVRSERPGAQSLSATGELVGTHRYLAPEAQEERPVGPPADVYGLGVTLFQLLTGRPPFEGEGFAILKQHAFDAPPPLRPLAPDVPQPLEALVLRLLAKDPGARGSAHQVADELDALRRAPARGRRRRRRVVWQAAVVAALGLSLGAVAALALSASRRQPPADTAAVASPAPLAPITAPPSPPAPPARPELELVEVKRGRVKHPQPPQAGKPRGFLSLSLSDDGELLVLGSAPGRWETWILDAESLETRDGPIALGASVADPKSHTLLGFTEPSRGELVRVGLDDPTRVLRAFEGPRPLPKLGASITFDRNHDRIFAAWEGSQPDPVDVFDSSGRRLDTILRPGMSIGKVLASPGGHVYFAFHRSADRSALDYDLLELGARGGRRTLGKRAAVAAAPRGEFVALADFSEAAPRLLRLVPGTDSMAPFAGVSLGGGVIVALGDERFVGSSIGHLHLYVEPWGEVHRLALDPTPSGAAAGATVLLYDGARQRVLAVMDDPTGQATRVVAFKVQPRAKTP